MEDVASDRGYHSDQSPDSLLDRSIQSKKNKPSKKGKQLKSARRSLATPKGKYLSNG